MEATGGELAAMRRVPARDEEEKEFRQLLRTKEEIKLGECSLVSGTHGDEEGREGSSLERRVDGDSAAAETVLSSSVELADRERRGWR